MTLHLPNYEGIGHAAPKLHHEQINEQTDCLWFAIAVVILVGVSRIDRNPRGMRSFLVFGKA
jgi:hypothetical protein